MSFFNSKLAWGLAWIALIGTGASLALGANLGLGLWLALVLAGLGCQAIVVWSRPVDTKPAAQREEQERALLGEFHRLLAECSIQFERQLRSMREELDQVQNLLSDAIGALTGLFDRLRKQARVQRDVAVSVVEGAAGATERREFEDFVEDISDVMQRVVDRAGADRAVAMELVELAGDLGESTGELAALLSTVHCGEDIAQGMGRLRLTVGKMDDAVRRLAEHDGGLAFESKQRIEELARAMGVRNQARVAALGQLGHVADDVDAQVAKAVRALQFQDIVSQLLAHVGRRIEAIDDVWKHLAELAQTLRQSAETADASDALRSLRVETGRVSERLNAMVKATENNPVSQRGLNQGAVELF